MQGRWMNADEREIVDRVFGDTLPWWRRIFITDMIGADNSPFTIPSDAIEGGLVTLSGAYGGFVLGGPLWGPAGAVIGFLIGEKVAQAHSFANGMYLINVGDQYPDMSKKNTGTLVHEMTHVWQGKNDWFAMTYVIESANEQITGIVKGGGMSARNGAYEYKGKLGQPWGSFNVEEQAQIVQDWFESSEPTSGDLWPYIRDYVRKGIS